MILGIQLTFYSTSQIIRKMTLMFTENFLLLNEVDSPKVWLKISIHSLIILIMQII